MSGMSCHDQFSSDAAFNRSCHTVAISPRLRVFAKMLRTSRSMSRLLNPQICEVQFRELLALLRRETEVRPKEPTLPRNRHGLTNRPGHVIPGPALPLCFCNLPPRFSWHTLVGRACIRQRSPAEPPHASLFRDVQASKHHSTISACPVPSLVPNPAVNC